MLDTTYLDRIRESLVNNPNYENLVVDVKATTLVALIDAIEFIDMNFYDHVDAVVREAIFGHIVEAH